MDGPPPQEEDFSSLPIPERLAHKNWKARVSAYESLIKTFQTTTSDSDPAFRPYVNNPDLLRKIVTDSNAVAQERGVECVVTLVKFAGETAARTRDSVVPALVDKCLGSARAGTKNQAIELILQYVEIENAGTSVVSDILPGLNAKQPKTVSACVFALKEVLRQFGPQIVPPPPVLKSLPKIFSHADKTVRSEGNQLARVLYQYIGPAIEQWLTELKPVQVKELQEAFEELDKEGKGQGTLRQERLTREQARQAESSQNAGEDEGGDTQAEEFSLPDPRMLAEPIDIVPKLPSNLQPGLSSSKWKDRKEALDDLLTVLNAAPRIREAPELGDLAKSLAHCIQKDANINCVMAAANCMEGLAKGMMVSFAKFRELVIPPMLERLKERKANVTDAIGIALDAVFFTTTLPDIIADVLPAFASKNPQVKEGSLKFLARCLSTSTTPVQPSQIKIIADPLATLMEDSFEGARNEAASCLGILMKMVGERPLNAVMDGLADVRKAKVKEAYEKATVKCKIGMTGPSKPPPSGSKGTVAKKKNPIPKVDDQPPLSAQNNVIVEQEALKKVSKPPSRLLTKQQPAGTVESSAKPSGSAAPKKPPTAAAASTAAAKPSKGAAAPLPSALDSFKYKHTPEDAEVLASELLPTSIMQDLGDSNWKTRLAAFDELTNWVESVVTELDAEVLVRALAKKGWAEKNFQVSAKLYGILCILAERSPSFSRSCVALCTGHLSEKLGDVKLKKPAGEALVSFAEKTSLQFVFNQAYEPLLKQKAPKVLADALAWMETAVAEFGIAGLSLRSLIDFLKSALKNSNAAVRTSATKTLVSVKLFAGPGIKDFLEDLNPQLLATIQSEFAKVEDSAAPEPIRISADIANMTPTATSASGKGASSFDPLDDLYPRVEIDALLKGTTILQDAKSDNWKMKKEALETLQAILDQGANKRLKPTMGEIGQVLKARVTDTNKAVQSLALDIVSRVATGMGKPFEKQSRFFVLPVATVLADQKATIRAAALQTLSAIAVACEGLDSMVHGLGSALESVNPTQRASLLGWIADYIKEHELISTLDLNSWAAPVVSCLDDRNGDVRKGAQAVLPALIACAGFEYVMQQTNSLKPASRSTAVPLIQAAHGNAALSVQAAISSAPAATNPRPDSIVVSATSISPQPQSPTSAATASKVPPGSKLTGVRRKLPLGTASRPESRAETVEESPVSRLPAKAAGFGLKRLGGTKLSAQPPPTAALPSSSTLLPFVSSNADAKRVRLGKDAQRWVIEAGPTRKDLVEYLHHQMEPCASKDLTVHLFSHDHNAINDYVSGLTSMYEFFSNATTGDDKLGISPDDMRAIALANFDLALKYVSLRIHEPQSNLVTRCLDVVDSVIAFLQSVETQISDAEAMCFIPTLIHKLGDAREPVRVRVQQIIQTLTKIYPYSRVFELLLEYGLKSKVAKTRQGTLDELASFLKRFGMGTCQPSKNFPAIAAMIADKDSQVRRAALSALSEGYSLVGETIWSLVGYLSPKDRTQLEERLRRVAGPSSPGKAQSPLPSASVTRLAAATARPDSPATMSKLSSLPRPSSPSVHIMSKNACPASPTRTLRSASPTTPNGARPASPMRNFKPPMPSGMTGASSPAIAGRPKTMLPSRLGQPRTRPNFSSLSSNPTSHVEEKPDMPMSVHSTGRSSHHPTQSSTESLDGSRNPLDNQPSYIASDDITVTISSILSSDTPRSVDALKNIQKILMVNAEEGHSSQEYRDLAEHTEGLIETITLQMTHVFDHPEDLVAEDNYRLAKHLIQTLNIFCDHTFLAESLTVDILTSLLEELTLRLLQTDESQNSKVKDLSRFINMIILRLFATGRRMSIFRALFNLLLQIVKPFPSSGTSQDSKESRVAELVLKCIWKLARNIPQDLKEGKLDPVELFPAIEHFLQSIPPNEWRARATNKVPCGDMPLRTIKVIIQHVVAYYGDDVYDFLSTSFDDPSATIVYPYVYRVLNSSARGTTEQLAPTDERSPDTSNRPYSPGSTRPASPHGTSSSVASIGHRHSSQGHRLSPSSSSLHGNGIFSPPVEEPDPDAQLLAIIGHISSETTGALHKEGITELHQFLKNYPHKRPRVEKMLESTGAAFRKYINRALASRAAEDLERNVAVAGTLSKLESGSHEMKPDSPVGMAELSPRSSAYGLAIEPHTNVIDVQHNASDADPDAQLHRLHDIFRYNRSSTVSNGSSQGGLRPRMSESG